MSKEKAQKEQTPMPPPTPQLTFAEEDVRNLRAFLDFMNKHAKFTMDWEEALLLGRYTAFIQAHIKKVNDHVMELKHVVEQK